MYQLSLLIATPTVDETHVEWGSLTEDDKKQRREYMKAVHDYGCKVEQLIQSATETYRPDFNKKTFINHTENVDDRYFPADPSNGTPLRKEICIKFQPKFTSHMTDR